MATSLVSIILPTYNGAKYIRASIESCLRQTYTNIELIIVNDCSTDETGEIINLYATKDRRIKIITNEANKKLPTSLNIGFAAAEGDFFTWTSDDNLYSPLAIETLVKAIESDEQADIVYSSYYFIDENGKIIDRFGYKPENLLFKCAPGACFLYRRKVHEQLNGYDVTKFRMEDFDFWLRAATLFRYKYIDNVNLYYYRKHGNNLTTAIYSSPDIYDEYRENHLQSFQYFFNTGLDYNPGKKILHQHIELYFEDIAKTRNRDFDVAEKIINYLKYLDALQLLEWDRIGFDKNNIAEIINEKKFRMIGLVINDLLVENKMLRGKNPKISNLFNKPVSWYYKEYEVLPSWYKKIGHIIKAMQGNRSWKSLIKNKAK